MIDMQQHCFNAFLAVDVHGHKGHHAEVIDLQKNTQCLVHTQPLVMHPKHS